jgi:hypothetical protein
MLTKDSGVKENFNLSVRSLYNVILPFKERSVAQLGCSVGIWLEISDKKGILRKTE